MTSAPDLTRTPAPESNGEALSFERDGGDYRAKLPSGIVIDGRVLLAAPKGYLILILTLDSLDGAAHSDFSPNSAASRRRGIRSASPKSPPTGIRR